LQSVLVSQLWKKYINQNVIFLENNKWM
jgi:hypothetical protein